MEKYNFIIRPFGIYGPAYRVGKIRSIIYNILMYSFYFSSLIIIFLHGINGGFSLNVPRADKIRYFLFSILSYSVFWALIIVFGTLGANKEFPNINIDKVSENKINKNIYNINMFILKLGVLLFSIMMLFAFIGMIMK